MLKNDTISIQAEIDQSPLPRSTRARPVFQCSPSDQPTPPSPTCAWYKTILHPHFATSSFFSLHPSTSTHSQAHSYFSITFHLHHLHLYAFSHHHHQKCLQKLLRRSPPPVARPRPRPLPLRRRKLARRPPPLLLARRRREERRERRPTLHTSTRVSLQSIAFVQSHSY